MADDNSNDPFQQSSRFYEKEFPDVEECVMVKIKKVEEMGAYVTVSNYTKFIDIHS